MPRPRTRRLLIAATILAFLLAGAILNVLVALACARWTENIAATNWSDPVPVWTLPPAADAYLNDPQYLKDFGHTRETIVPREFVMDPNAPKSRLRETGLTHTEHRSLWITRTHWERWFDSTTSYSRSHEFVRFGFPMRSLQYETQWYSDIVSFPGFDSWRVPGPRGGWPIASDLISQSIYSPFLAPAHVYPIIPIPLGFALNTLLYAALLSLLLLASRHIRRARRRRKGLCLRCGYPIGASPVCTECGVEVEK